MNVQYVEITARRCYRDTQQVGAVSNNTSSGAGSPDWGSLTGVPIASASVQGIASFNSTNFAVVSGVVNTIQNIHSGASPTFAGLSLNGTLNIGSSGVLQIGGTIVIDASRNLSNIGTISSGLINAQTISSAANFTGTMYIAGDVGIGRTSVTSLGGNRRTLDIRGGSDGSGFSFGSTTTQYGRFFTDSNMILYFEGNLSLAHRPLINSNNGMIYITAASTTIYSPSGVVGGGTLIVGTVQVTGLTASRFVQTDGSKNLASFDLFGTANTWNATQAIASITLTTALAVTSGGTGVTALSDVLGTTNQITVTGGTARVIGGNVTLSLPQNIHSAASPTFAGLTINGTLFTPTINFAGGWNNTTITAVNDDLIFRPSYNVKFKSLVDDSDKIVFDSRTGNSSFSGWVRGGVFANSQANSGEAWFGRAADRVLGTFTMQLGGVSAVGTNFEIVDRGWTKVMYSFSGEAPANSLAINSSGNALFAGSKISLTPATGNAELYVLTNAGNGSAFVHVSTNNNEWSFGIDKNDSNKFKLSNYYTLNGTNDRMTATTSGDFTFTGSGTFGGTIQSGVAGFTATPHVIYAADVYSGGGHASFVGNWASSGYWGIGQKTAVSDSTLKLAGTDASGAFNGLYAHLYVYGTGMFASTISTPSNMYAAAYCANSTFLSDGTIGVDADGDLYLYGWSGGSSVRLTDGEVDINAGSLILSCSYINLNGNTFASGSISPALTDTYDLGSSTFWWRQQFVSQINATIFAEQTQTLLGGWFTVGKDQGKLPYVYASQTTIDFGKEMTVGHFILIKAHDYYGNIKTEYMQIGSLVSATTYNVTRDLAGANSPDPVWVDGTPYLLLGTNGSGRIELNAYDTPRISIMKQGATYNAQSEVLRIGDINGLGGAVGETYGFFVGSGSKYLCYNSVADTLRVTGTINAASGNIGGWSINSNRILQDIGGNGRVSLNADSYGGYTSAAYGKGLSVSIDQGTDSYAIFAGEVPLSANGGGGYSFGSDGANTSRYGLWFGRYTGSPMFEVSVLNASGNSSGFVKASIAGWNFDAGSLTSPTSVNGNLIKISSATTAWGSIANNSVYIGNTSNYSAIAIKKDGSNYVLMYSDGATGGVQGVYGGITVFSLRNDTTSTIAGWNFDGAEIYKGTNGQSDWTGMQSATGTGISFFAGATNNLGASAKFQVLADGSLYATSATITGTVNAAAGNIGGWNILSDRINYLATGGWLLGIYSTGQPQPSILVEGAGGFGATIGKLVNNGSAWLDEFGIRIQSTTNVPFFQVSKNISSGAITAQIAGWSFDNAYLWTGTKQTSDTYSSSGITIAAAGAIRAKEFYIANSGSAYFKGTVSGATVTGGTITGTDIFGGTVTGSTVQTNTSGNRILIDYTATLSFIAWDPNLVAESAFIQYPMYTLDSLMAHAGILRVMMPNKSTWGTISSLVLGSFVEIGLDAKIRFGTVNTSDTYLYRSASGTLKTDGAFVFAGLISSTMANNSAVFAHANKGRMQFYTADQAGVLSWSNNALNLGFNSFEDGTTWQCGASGAASSIFRVLSGSFTWNYRAASSSAVPTTTMALDSSGNLVVQGYIAVAGVLSTAAGVQISSTTVIDSSRNLTNIGTIFAGGTVTATGAVIVQSSANPYYRLTDNASVTHYLEIVSSNLQITVNGGSALSFDKITRNATFASNGIFGGDYMRCSGTYGFALGELSGVARFRWNGSAGEFQLFTSSNAYANARAASWINNSDARLKTDIQPVQSAMAALKTLQGVFFRWINGDAGRHLGFLAQNVEAVLPGAVTSDDRGYKGVAYNEVIPLLVEGVKETYDEVSVLRSRVSELETEVAILKVA